MMLLLSGPAFADHPGGGTSVSVAGVTLSCPTSAGGMVWWVVSRYGGPIGTYNSRGGVSWSSHPTPHIFLNPGNLSRHPPDFGYLPPAVQIYIALHECAHFHLPREQNTELNADCWTVRTGLANGWFSAADLTEVRRKLAENPHGWGHPGSGIHVENIPRCLSGR